ncbi:MAG: CRISPR-associated protein Cas5 [Longicatena sp.]
MKALRIVLHQTSANYRKEETIENKMTYPLPPPSTVIGALHNACNYTCYHPMDISIQGHYESMHKEPYTDYCFLNSTMDDRGMLVKMKNETMLSNAFEKVASAKKSQGNSFRNNVTIQVHNQELLEEFQNLKLLSEKLKNFKETKIKPVMLLIKIRKNNLADKKKKFMANSQEYTKVLNREQELKTIEKDINRRLKEYEMNYYTKPITKYKSLTTSLKFYEVLNQITLILHVKADEATLFEIKNHIYNLKAIGRSEDFVDVEEAELVELNENIEIEELTSHYSAYVDIELVRKHLILPPTKVMRQCLGTKYMLAKDYEIVNNQRIFKRKKALYLSNHIIEQIEPSENLYADNGYIVNFL